MQTRKLILAAAIAAALSGIAQANPTASSSSNMSIDDSSNGKTSRERSMSVDRSNSSKASRSNSSDSSREHARESSRTTKRARDQKSSRDIQHKINVNAMLIQGFIRNYETRQEPGGLGRAFFKCQPFGGLDAFFPVAVTPTDYADIESQGNIVPRVHVTRSGLFGIDMNNPAPMTPPIAVIRDGRNFIGGYIMCRIAAHHFITAAADRLQAEEPFSGPQALEDAIDRIYQKDMISPAITTEIADETSQSMLEIRQCAPFIYTFKNAKGHNIDCGVFAIDGRAFIVDGVPTLSTDAINGQKYEVSLSASTSESASTDQASKISDSRKSSSKATVSREASRESKHSVGMKKSRSSESSGSLKSDRSAGSKTEAGPRD